MSDLIDRQAAIDAIGKVSDELYKNIKKGATFPQRQWFDGMAQAQSILENLPSAQPNIKQSAKLLSDFIESCPGGDSYLITPDGEELRTDWGYATEGLQLIYDWAERRNNG